MLPLYFRYFWNFDSGTSGPRIFGTKATKTENIQSPLKKEIQERSEDEFCCLFVAPLAERCEQYIYSSVCCAMCRNEFIALDTSCGHLSIKSDCFIRCRKELRICCLHCFSPNLKKHARNHTGTLVCPLERTVHNLGTMINSSFRSAHRSIFCACLHHARSRSSQVTFFAEKKCRITAFLSARVPNEFLGL